MNARQQVAIEQHGSHLLAIFPNATERDPMKLCKALRKLEAQAHAIALRLCNGPEFPGGDDAVDRRCETILRKVNTILGNTDVPIFLNRDPRGYALKIREEAVKGMRIHRDWGGYGIIAPEIGRNGE